MFTIVTICIVLFTSVGLCATFYVDVNRGDDSNDGISTGTAWRTLSKVNSHTFSPGDNILLKRGGEWHEQLTVPSSGSPGNPITFGAYGEGKRPAINASGDHQYAVLSPSKAHLVFRDLVTSNATRSSFCAKGKAGDFKLVRVDADRSDFGFEFDDTDSITFLECSATHNKYYGFLFKSGCSSVRLEDSSASYNGSRGVQFDNGVEGENVIEGGEYHHHSADEADGVAFDTTSGILIENVSFHNNSNGADEGDAIQLFNTEGAIIRYCTFARNLQGIAVTGQTKGGQVYYNLFRKNINQQIVFSDASNTTHEFSIYNNVFYLDSGNAVLFTASAPSASVKVKNNIFHLMAGATVAIDLEKRLADDAVALDHNCYYHEAEGNILSWQGTVYTTQQLKTFQLNEQQDSASFSKNPLWVDAEDGDFSLRAGSPCIDKGLDVGLRRGFPGTIVPKGLSVDIGAFEYQGTVAPNPPQAFRIVQ